MKLPRHLWIASAAILTIVVNLAANYFRLNGLSTAQVSDRYLTFFTPAGYVFAIWGVIYLGLLGYVAYEYMAKNVKKAQWLSDAAPWFILAAIMNCVWIVLWHYELLAISVVIMLVLLVSLIKLYTTLEVGFYPVSFVTRWMVHIPVSVYLGWISVATIANIAAALTQAKWDGAGIPAEVWSMILVTVAMTLALWMLQGRRDYAFALVVVWALVGIGYKWGTILPLVMGTVVASVIAVVAAMALQTVKPHAKFGQTANKKEKRK